MFNKMISGTVRGIDGIEVQVEVDISSGLPTFEMVGYLSSEVKEAKERVRTALRNSGYVLPPKRITVNLSPADLKKEGSAFDLPIAIAILTSLGYIHKQKTSSYFAVGELSLDGKINPIQGVLPLVDFAKKRGLKSCIVPEQNQLEGCVVKGIDVYGFSHLKEVVDFLNEVDKRNPVPFDEKSYFEQGGEEYDFKDVVGQESIKRAVEIAVAGRHNLLLEGPPGAGKSMIAKRIPSIMPDLTLEESLELTKIYSISGLLGKKDGLLTKRPFRAPHHTSSQFSIVGGGRIPKPGEISLAHHGVLFLDEMPEFSRSALEIMRQPLEDGKITLSRVNASCEFPANFMLVAAMNPCPCGYFPDYNRCSCSPNMIQKYQNKISQPLLDRIDINMFVEPVGIENLQKEKKGEGSKQMKARVEKAHEIQRKRYKNCSFSYNGQMTPKEIGRFVKIKPEHEPLLKTMLEKYKLSARAYHRILKVARTIADLEQSETIETQHLIEAVSYRRLSGERE